MEEKQTKPASFIDTAVAIFKEISVKWGEKNTGLMAAAIAFYSMMSLAPLLVFVIGAVGLFFNESAVKDRLLVQITRLLGTETAEFVAGVIDGAFQLDNYGPVLAVIGALLILFFASTVFNSVKLALNAIWDVTPDVAPRTGIIAVLWDRLLAAAMVLLTGGALFVVMVSSVVTSVIGSWLEEEWPEVAGHVSFSGQWVMALLLVFLITVAYKWLPDTAVSWWYALAGAILASFLFIIGNRLMGIYFSLSALPTIYGAAGSLVVLLLWVYYSSHILLFGAFFTRALSRQRVEQWKR